MHIEFRMEGDGIKNPRTGIAIKLQNFLNTLAGENVQNGIHSFVCGVFDILSHFLDGNEKRKQEKLVQMQKVEDEMIDRYR